jgi:hypothetical protein
VKSIKYYSLGGHSVCNTDKSELWGTPWDCLRWNDKHTKFHIDQSRHSSNIKSITWTVWEAIVLVLLMRGIHDVRHWDGLMHHDIHVTKLHENWYRRSSNFKVASLKFEMLKCWYCLWENLWCMTLRCFHVERHSYQVSQRFVQAFKQYSDSASVIWMAVKLVLLIERNYIVRSWNGFRWHDISIKFREDWYKRRRNITGLFKKVESL